MWIDVDDSDRIAGSAIISGGVDAEWKWTEVKKKIKRIKAISAMDAAGKCLSDRIVRTNMLHRYPVKSAWGALFQNTDEIR